MMELLKAHGILLLAAAAICGGVSSAAFAQESDSGDWAADWQISVTNTVRAETYDTDGNKAASPYQFEGGQFYDEFSISFSKRSSPYEEFRGQFYGALNDSEYRGADDGFIPERFNLFYENGGGGTPYRVELGDFYGYLSYRTLQRTLKGGQFEFQPDLGGGRLRHSIQIFAGTADPSWRHLDPEEDWSLGASWLIEDKKLGRVSFNVVRNGTEGPTQNLGQWVWSAAGEARFKAGSQNLLLEGELALFHGEHGAAAEWDSRSDSGLYLQLSGRNASPFGYRLRFERYGEDFRPNGARITPDRRSLEAHGDYRLPGGMVLRGRLQHYKDRLESDNPANTTVGGLNLSGPLFASFIQGASASIDAYIQGADDRDGTIDNLTKNLNMNFNWPIGGGWQGRTSVFLQDQNDQTDADSDRNTKRVMLSATRALSFQGFTGSVTPGLTIRGSGGLSRTAEWRPSLAMSLNRGHHSMNFNWNYQILNLGNLGV